MKQEFTLESLHDWTIAIDHAYVKYDDPERGLILLFIESVHNYYASWNKVLLSGIRILVDWSTGEMTNSEYFSEERFKEANFIWEHPPIGYVNHAASAYYLVRKPRRQWRRGYSSENYYSVGTWRMSQLGSKSHAVSIFSNIKETILDSYSKVLSGDYKSRAFSDNYAFVQWVILPDTVFLEYKGNIIGVVDDELVAHLPASVDFLQEELSQYLEVNIV